MTQYQLAYGRIKLVCHYSESNDRCFKVDFYRDTGSWICQQVGQEHFSYFFVRYFCPNIDGLTQLKEYWF